MSAILLELTNSNPPVGSQEALQAFACTPSVLNGKPVIDIPESASYSEARVITILYRTGLAAQQKGAVQKRSEGFFTFYLFFNQVIVGCCR